MENERVKLIEKDVNPFFSKFCFWGITVDIFFLPYLSFMAVSVSVILVGIWIMINYKRVTWGNEETLFIIMLGVMLLGTFCNLLYEGPVRFETSFSTAIKRFFQFFLCFSCYFFYKQYFTRHCVDIKPVVFWAVIYIAIFALLYKQWPHEYAAIKIMLNPADNHTRRYLENLVDYRFNYLWTDPNNVSYLISGLATWYMLQTDGGYLKKLLILCTSLFIAFCTVSNGGLIVFLLMGILVIFYEIKKIYLNGIKRKTVLFLLILMLCFIVFINITDILDIIKNQYLALFIQRLGAYTNNRTGGRGADLLLAFEYLNPIMIIMGTGHEGVVSEIGHIYWIGMYGGIAYVIFMWIMFRKIKSQLWVQYIWSIPFFIGFTMNIAIGEYKWMAIYLFLLAYMRYGNGYKVEYNQ